MKRYRVTWVEYHEAVVYAVTPEDAEELAVEKDGADTYEESDDMQVTEVPE